MEAEMSAITQNRAEAERCYAAPSKAELERLSKELEESGNCATAAALMAAFEDNFEG